MPPPATASVALASLLGTPSIVLQRGDNDALSRWGGKKHSGAGDQPVRALQQALVAIGAMSANPDGEFGKKTQDGIKRFQWYLLRIGFRLRLAGAADAAHGSVLPYAQPTGVAIDGFLREATLRELLGWIDGGFQATSPLVALDVGLLPNISLGSGFDVLDYPAAGSREMLVHQDFVPWVKALDSTATDEAVTLRVNQAFRVQGLPVSGAVVPPASNSQHLIGHALDVNIVDGSTVNTSAMFKAGKATQAAKDFVAAAKKLGLRWGGDFSPKDPPHFDKRVLHTSDDYLNSFYFAQQAYNRRHALRKA